MDLTTQSELGSFSLKKIPWEGVKHCINIESVGKEQNEAKAERGGCENPLGYEGWGRSELKHRGGWMLNHWQLKRVRKWGSQTMLSIRRMKVLGFF